MPLTVQIDIVKSRPSQEVLRSSMTVVELEKARKCSAPCGRLRLRRSEAAHKASGSPATVVRLRARPTNRVLFGGFGGGREKRNRTHKRPGKNLNITWDIFFGGPKRGGATRRPILPRIIHKRLCESRRTAERQITRSAK